jgi:hypothetical protein
LLHVAIIIGGADWYRFFGAGEGMAQLAESGSISPAIITMAIAVVLAIWAMYAFSGAGIIRRLPLLKPALVVIAATYTIRGIMGVPLVIFSDHPYLNELEGQLTFMIVSSIISLSFGLFHLIGLVQIWNHKPNQERILDGEESMI